MTEPEPDSGTEPEPGLWNQTRALRPNPHPTLKFRIMQKSKYLISGLSLNIHGSIFWVLAIFEMLEFEGT